ncbi:hypothetical protein SASPL_105808 [Salvia splendens]|uniref:Probable magnesium transporter n=1 Tax=Salvia splendens TaxID=180675 RepID=A0A8X9AB46_SALSN|nr:hypothetical protein SASPL_105808 [Salvia splendens]
MASEQAATDEMSDSYRGMSSENIKGLVLALSSSLFIGASFIVKKKGLKKAGASGVRAGVGGYSYLYEPLWWIGLITRDLSPIPLMVQGFPWVDDVFPDMMNYYWITGYYFRVLAFERLMLQNVAGCFILIVGEIANFAAYAFAPAILVTPLGALSIIIRHGTISYLSCALCVVGSTTIVLHAPQEREIESVKEVWDLATEPAFVLYATLVMSVKALGIALKLTLSGTNQLIYPQTWVFVMIVLSCVLTQLNYLNKALDTFNTAVVSPIYYVMFTSLTIVASVIMFKDWDRQNLTQIVTEICGFVTILSGTFLLHKTKDMADGCTASRLAKHDNEDSFVEEGIPLKRQDAMRTT